MDRHTRITRSRRELDRQISTLAPLREAQLSNAGWIKTIRDSLDMSQAEMANRLSVSQPAVTQLETRELAGSITLDALQRAAEALGCEVVYALVPKGAETTLQSIVETQARRAAEGELAPVIRTMQLEGQGLDSERIEERVHERALAIIRSGTQWRD